ncbi:MAG: hypothetical protein ACJZ9F_08970 [Rhodospirillaceae bacterium]
MTEFKHWGQLAAALMVLQIVLVLPDWPGNLVPLWFIRLPAELPVIVLAVLLSHGLWQRRLCALIAGGLTVLTVLKFANLTAFTGFARPFNILVDPGLFGIALHTLSGGHEIVVGVSLAITIAIAIAAVFVAMRWALMVLASIWPLGFRMPGIVFIGILAIGAVGLKDIKIGSAWWPVTSVDTTKFAAERARSISEGIRNDAQFRQDMATDQTPAIPSDRLLASLKGTDFLLIFVESYGRTALDDPTHAETLRATLRQFEDELVTNGFGARSAWLTSPTFGGQSWLAHGTLLSGLWLDNQSRYDSLFIRDRATLITDFHRSGWRTLAVMPQITRPWADAALFGYDKVYTATNLDYAGQPFNYVTMPDQYTLSVLDAHELSASDRPSVMAEIGLVSSHHPWTPIPRLIPWDTVGRGEIFDQARSPFTGIDWNDRAQLKYEYTHAIEYVLQTLKSYIVTRGRNNFVMLIVGDHQPSPIVSGQSAPHDVPAHFISGDPSLLGAIDNWNWTSGMLPDESSPVWRMDGMRAQILNAFTPSGGAPASTSTAQAGK